MAHPQSQTVKLEIKELQVTNHQLQELVNHKKFKKEALLPLINLKVVLKAVKSVQIKRAQRQHQNKILKQQVHTGSPLLYESY